MIDIAHIRREFVKFLAENYHKSKSLDGALMHVVELAYKKGLEDAKIPVDRHITWIDSAPEEETRI
jgi:hypothetical protein